MFSGEYIRPHIGRGVKGILIVTIGVFLLDMLLNPSAALSSNRMSVLTPLFGLSFAGIKHLMIWQFFTYMFIHANLFHLVANMFGLFFVGNILEPIIGTKRFVYFYLISGMIGGLAWLLISGIQMPTIPCIGASASVFAIICAFGAINPRRKMTLLVYFVFPVSMTALTLVLLLVGSTIFMMLFGFEGNIAHTAHLAGAAAGWAYGRIFCGASMWNINSGRKYAYNQFNKKWCFRDLKALYKRSKFKVYSNPEEPVNWSEVDAILDKIKIRGFSGLSREEKALLDRASRQKR